MDDSARRSTGLKLAASNRLHRSSSGGLATGGWPPTSPALWNNLRQSTRIAPVTIKRPRLRHELANVGRTYCQYHFSVYRSHLIAYLAFTSELARTHAIYSLSSLLKHIVHSPSYHNSYWLDSTKHVLVDWLLHNCQTVKLTQSDHGTGVLTRPTTRELIMLAAVEQRSTQTKALSPTKTHNTKLSEINSHIIISFSGREFAAGCWF